MSIPNETDYNFFDPYNLIAGFSMGLVGLFGISCNILVVYSYFGNASEKTSFNTLGVTRATANLYILVVIYSLIFLPTTFLGFTPFIPIPLVSILISFGMALYATNENQTLLTALNRFFALYFPFHYSKLCGMKPTICFILLIYVYRLGEVIVPIFQSSSSRNNCWLYYSPNYLSWAVTESETCFPYNGAILVALQIFTLTTIFNVATFGKVLYFYRNKFRTDAVSRQKENKNIFLFFQTVLQDFLYVIDFSFTFYFGLLIQHRLWTFISGTLIWQTVHAIDGFIMIIFSDKITFLKMCCVKSVPPTELQSNRLTDLKRHSISAALVTIN